jgi:hypothetical protein
MLQSKNALLSTFLFLDQFVWLGRSGIYQVGCQDFPVVLVFISACYYYMAIDWRLMEMI